MSGNVFGMGAHRSSDFEVVVLQYTPAIAAVREGGEGRGRGDGSVHQRTAHILDGEL